jgi:hypothetical protein
MSFSSRGPAARVAVKTLSGRLGLREARWTRSKEISSLKLF